MQRVITYVDGFNLYYGLRSKNWRRYYWLNLRELSLRLLKPDQHLVCVKYFTARISYPPDKVDRQNSFIEALETLPDLYIFYGKYQVNPQICPSCGATSYVPGEKMTDVNIAVEILTDAYQNLFDTAILISADSDLNGPVQAIRRLFPERRILAAFPPNRTSWELRKSVNAYFTIGRALFKGSQFPDEIQKSDGYVLKRPENWR